MLTASSKTISKPRRKPVDILEKKRSKVIETDKENLKNNIISINVFKNKLSQRMIKFRSKTIQKNTKILEKNSEIQFESELKASMKPEMSTFTEQPETPIRRSTRVSIMNSPLQSPISKTKTSCEYVKVNIKPEAPKIINEDPFNIAKRAFHRSGAFKIVGRVEEKAEIISFWSENVNIGRGASIYISGNPGTGKTALIDEMIPELIKESTALTNFNFNLIKINCMMLKDPLKTFYEIAHAIDKSLTTEKNPYLIINALEKYFTSESLPENLKNFSNDSGTKKNNYFIVFIDEIDQIGMKDPELLCRLLAISYLPNVSVSIIGIANSIDLTERFLPRLKMLNCSPVLLNFLPYTVPDITAILYDRLEQIKTNLNLEGHLSLNFIDKTAIELTARKVASTGDLRRALDILRQAIDLAEDEHKILTKDLLTTGALVKLSHVVKIMEKFGNSQSGPLVLLKSLNLHQKVILAAILGFIYTEKILTIQKLYEEYCTVGGNCTPKLYDPVTRSEFIDLISNLESMSIIGKSTNTAGKSLLNSESTGNSLNLKMDLWQLKIYLQVPNELVKTMICQELPTIKALFGV